jgi:hypothetical protein
MLVPLAIAIVPILILFTYAAAQTARHTHALKSARVGPGYSREDFIASFRSDDIPDEITATVYDYYSSPSLQPGFPIAPSDRIEDDLNYAGEDREDQFGELLSRLKLKMIPEYILERHGPWGTGTLGDLVLLLDCIRRNQPAKR